MNGRLAIIGLAVTLALAPAVKAASQDECAIWLCLPGGFPPGCGSAYKAMRKRLTKLKPPLPAFSACATGDSSGITSEVGIAAFVPGATYLKGKRCRQIIGEGGGVVGTWPPGCTSTFSWAEVFVDGEQAGETYYWQ